MGKIKLDGRLGISLDITREELNVLAGPDRAAAKELLIKLVQSEQCHIVGDTYFPVEWNEDVLEGIDEDNLEFDLPVISLYDNGKQNDDKSEAYAVLEHFGLNKSSDISFHYRMLDRLRSDCEYYLGNGNRYAKHLWAGNEKDHIEVMKALWETFPEKGKPEWLPYEKILDYEKKMIEPLKERVVQIPHPQESSHQDELDFFIFMKNAFNRLPETMDKQNISAATFYQHICENDGFEPLKEFLDVRDLTDADEEFLECFYHVKKEWAKEHELPLSVENLIADAADRSEATSKAEVFKDNDKDISDD